MISSPSFFLFSRVTRFLLIGKWRRSALIPMASGSETHNSHACCRNSSVTKPPGDRANAWRCSISLRVQASRTSSSFGDLMHGLGSASGTPSTDDEGVDARAPRSSATRVLSPSEELSSSAMMSGELSAACPRFFAPRPKEWSTQARQPSQISDASSVPDTQSERTLPLIMRRDQVHSCPELNLALLAYLNLLASDACCSRFLL